MIEQRISAGGIVVQDGMVLLVRHIQEGKYDFWVMPGGGIEGGEGIFKTAEREVWEETNLTVRAERIAYIQELMDEGRYVCKCWVVCRFESGQVSLENKVAGESFLQEAGFFTKEEVRGMNVFPIILKDVFWEDVETGFPVIKYLGYEQYEPG